jgi:addiction module RelE/StbE family toxin
MNAIWSIEALKQLEKIRNYIAKNHPANADHWVDRITTKAYGLVATPEIGRIVPEIGSRTIRELIIGNYRMIYQVSAKSIFILTVRNFKQKLPRAEMKFIKGIDSL